MRSSTARAATTLLAGITALTFGTTARADDTALAPESLAAELIPPSEPTIDVVEQPAITTIATPAVELVAGDLEPSPSPVRTVMDTLLYAASDAVAQVGDARGGCPTPRPANDRDRPSPTAVDCPLALQFEPRLELRAAALPAFGPTGLVREIAAPPSPPPPAPPTGTTEGGKARSGPPAWLIRELALAASSIATSAVDAHQQGEDLEGWMHRSVAEYGGLMGGRYYGRASCEWVAHRLASRWAAGAVGPMVCGANEVIGGAAGMLAGRYVRNGQTYQDAPDWRTTLRELLPPSPLTFGADEDN